MSSDALLCESGIVSEERTLDIDDNEKEIKSSATITMFRFYFSRFSAYAARLFVDKGSNLFSSGNYFVFVFVL